MIKKPKKIEIVTHYAEDDEDCYGDYYSIELFFDDKRVLSASDYYHDKGDIKVDAWLKGFEAAVGKLPPVKYTNRADGKT